MFFRLAALAMALAITPVSANPAESVYYDRAQAREYAALYTEMPCKAFLDFSKNGGDCTNFVSQILAAGGMPMTRPLARPGAESWYYYGAKWGAGRSAAWTRANDFSVYWQAHCSELRLYMPEDFDDLAEWEEIFAFLDVGDVIQYKSVKTGKYYHSQAVFEMSASEREYRAIVCQHSVNGYRSLRTYAAALPADDTIIALYKMNYPPDAHPVIKSGLTRDSCAISREKLLEFIDIRIDNNRQLINSVLYQPGELSKEAGDALVAERKEEIARLREFRDRVITAPCDCVILWQEYWERVVMQKPPGFVG